MIWLLLVALSAAASWMALSFLGLDAVAYRSLRRAVHRGQLDDKPGPVVKKADLNAFGMNPHLALRYVAYELAYDEVAVVRGGMHPDSSYLSVIVYDTLLQSVLPQRCPGPTLLTDRELDIDEHGAFVVLLAHADPQAGPWLDVSSVAKGVFMERHAEAAPESCSTIEVVQRAALSAHLERLAQSAAVER